MPRTPSSKAPAAPEPAKSAELAHSGGEGALSGLGLGFSIPGAQRARLDPIFGSGIDNVRLHTDAPAAEVARSHGAIAVTEGSHVAFDTGRYQPGTLFGDALLAHEVAHTRQQQSGGRASGSDRSLESEANRAGFITALRMFDPARAAQLEQPSFSQGGLRLQRCAPNMDGVSNIGELPSREDYERRGELSPRGFGTIMLPADASLIDIRLPPMSFVEPSATSRLMSARERGPVGHPNPIPTSLGADEAPIEPNALALRLGGIENTISDISALLSNDRNLEVNATVALFHVRGETSRALGGEHWLIVMADADPALTTPTDPTELAREVARTEVIVDRIYEALVELGSDRALEERTGRAMADASETRPGGDYDVDAALLEIDDVRTAYAESLLNVLAPRMIESYNEADRQHGQLGPSLMRRKLDYYESYTSGFSGIEDSTREINAWASDLQTQLTELNDRGAALTAARELNSTEVPSLEADFVARADLIATSIEALGEWDMAVQAYEFLAGNSALWGFSGVDAIAGRLAQMRTAAFDGDTEYLKLLLRDHRGDANVAEFFRSLPEIVQWSQFIIMLGILLIAGVLAAGVGLGAAAAAGSLLGAAGVAEGSMLMLSATFVARVGAEALVFTLVSRTLASAFPGMTPHSPFWVDFLWNFGLFAVMRGVGMALRGPMRAMSTLSRFVVQHGTTFGILQTYGVLRFSIENGRLPTGSELGTMTIQNLIMMVSLGLAMKVFEPGFQALEARVEVARFQRAYGSEILEIEAARAELAAEVRQRMEANPDATEADLADLRSRAEALDAQLNFLIERAVNDSTIDHNVLRREMIEALGRLERSPLPQLLHDAGIPPRFDIMPAGRDGAWSFTHGAGDAFVEALGRSFEVTSDTNTAAGRVIEATIPGRGQVRFIERPTAERVVLDLSVAEIEAARARIADETAAGGTRGRGVYPTAEAPVQTGATVGTALRGMVRGLGAEGLHIEGVTPGEGNVAARLRVEVPATESAAATTVEVPVEIQVVPELTGSVHGEAGGHARLIIRPEGTGHTVRIEIDARLRSDADVQHNLRHELREAGFILGDLARDPHLDIYSEMEARIFREGEAGGRPSAHDRATALEMRDLLSEVQRAMRAYETARTAAARRSGRALDQPVMEAGEAAFRRLDALLDAMGFRDPATRAAKQQSLLDMLGVDATSPIARYLESYGARTEASVARRAALDRLDPTIRDGLTNGLGENLAPHLNERVPDAAIDPLAQAMSRTGTGTAIRNVLRELMRAHRTGRISDAQLTDIARWFDQMTLQYGEALRTGEVAAELARELQRDPQRVPGRFGIHEANIVEGGVTEVPVPLAPPAGPGGAAVHLHPEPALTGNGRHGIAWPETAARHRMTLPDESPYQSKFGSLRDVYYAIECARQLVPEGTPGGQFEDIFMLPADHTNVVYQQGVSGAQRPDAIYVLVRPNGEVHAYPGILANMNLVGGRPARAAVR